MPDKIANAPQLLVGLSFYFTAFLALSSCRPIGMSEGRIPWLAVHEYACRMGLNEEEFEDLWILVNSMDAAYTKHRAKQRQTPAT